MNASSLRPLLCAHSARPCADAAARDIAQLPHRVHGGEPVCVGSREIALNWRRNNIPDVVAPRLSALMSQFLVFPGTALISFLFSGTILKKCR